MATSVHILCGPAGSGKTHALLGHCRAARGPGTILWLAPSARRAEQVRALVAATTGQSGSDAGRRRGGAGVVVRTFQDFADEVVAANDPAARPLSRVQRRLLVDEVIAELHGRGNLAHFARVLDTRGFAEGLLDLLEELKSQEIWPGQFARAAHRRPEDGTAEQPRAPHNGHAKERQLARLYARYQQRLVVSHLLDPEGRLWRARDLLAVGSCRPFEHVQAVFVDDFVDLSPTQHDILDALHRRGAELWLTLPDEPDEDRAELFAVSRATFTYLQRFIPHIEYLASREVFLPSPPGGEGGKRARPRGWYIWNGTCSGRCGPAAPLTMRTESRSSRRREHSGRPASSPGRSRPCCARARPPRTCWSPCATCCPTPTWCARSSLTTAFPWTSKGRSR